jgi:hypothetical protein
MSAATRIALATTEPLTWAEICEQYPDQWVYVVEIDYIHPRGFEFRTARVISHGQTRREAYDQARLFRDYYELIGHYFTGSRAMQPLLRPSVILDDELRVAIRYRR